MLLFEKLLLNTKSHVILSNILKFPFEQPESKFELTGFIQSEFIFILSDNFLFEHCVVINDIEGSIHAGISIN